MKVTPLESNPLRSRFSDEFFTKLPTGPGVYLMKDGRGRLIYVGRAKNLRHRLRSYRHAKPGKVGENVIELVSRVRFIHWEECESERRAADREIELIRAFTPTYNLADCWTEDYLFIGIAKGEKGRWEFRLSGDEEKLPAASGFEFFGCYRHRRKTKSAYLALLRVLHAAVNRKPRFNFPAKISRSVPPYVYSLRGTDELSRRWFVALRDFLAGRDDRFLKEILGRLLENETIPAFMRPGIQADFDLLLDFYAGTARPLAPGPRTLTQAELRAQIRGSLKRS